MLRCKVQRSIRCRMEKPFLGSCLACWRIFRPNEEKPALTVLAGKKAEKTSVTHPPGHAARQENLSSATDHPVLDQDAMRNEPLPLPFLIVV